MTLKNGSVLKSTHGQINYNGKNYGPTCRDDQSYDNQWGVGTHTVECEIMGFKSSFDVTITETPIKELKAENVSIIEGTNRYIDSYWDGENSYEYYCYRVSPEYTVTLKDGTVLESSNGWINYNGKEYRISCNTSQSYDNQWGIGTYTAECEIMGVKAEFNVKIIESPYTKIEILRIRPLEEGIDSRIDPNGNVIYREPEVIFKLTDKDGNTTESSNYIDDIAYLEYDQEENPWTIGGENRFVLHYATLSVEGSAIIKKASDYAYYEDYESGGVYIYDCRIAAPENLVLPSQIDGLPVLGIDSLGWSESLSLVKSITIPDSVEIISEYAFDCCAELAEFKVDGKNNFFSAENGVLFNKDKTELIAYPKGKSGNYVIPNSVTDIVYGAFYECDGLTDITIPSSVKSIESRAFESCFSLTSVTIPSSVTHIGEEAFGYFFNYEIGEYDKIPNFTIYGYAGTAAEAYAIENGFDFKALADVAPVKTLVLENGEWYYYVNGNKSYETTLCYFANTWFYVENGKVNWSARTLCNYNGDWFFVENGMVNWNATTLCYFADTWFYVENGVLNWNARTLCNFANSWFFVENGTVNWGARTLCDYYGNWFYVENGTVNWNATTLCYFADTWFYVENGVLNWNATTLCYFANTWFYVENGILNWNARTLCLFADTWFFVENGTVNWNAYTTCEYNGYNFNVAGGVVVF